MNNFSKGVTAIVDLGRVLGDAARTQLATTISATPGVTRAEFSPHVNRVMLVQYDTRTINAEAIRVAVQRKTNAAVRLIGM